MLLSSVAQPRLFPEAVLPSPLRAHVMNEGKRDSKTGQDPARTNLDAVL